LPMRSTPSAPNLHVGGEAPQLRSSSSTLTDQAANDLVEKNDVAFLTAVIYKF
jgi:hypothetical protein